MKATELPRMKMMDADKAVADSRIELASKAKKQLGYQVLSQTIAEPQALLFALGKLGIQPFDSAHVRAYMTSKEKRGMWSGTKIGIASIFLTVTFFSFFMTGMSKFPENAHWPVWIYGLNTFTACTGVGCAIWAVIWACTEEWQHGYRKLTEWSNFQISDYKGSIPEFVLSKALQIQDSFPDAHFQVVQLTTQYEHKTAPLPLPDPFLYVTAGKYANEGYYIDVWDEKAYEKEL